MISAGYPRAYRIAALIVGGLGAVLWVVVALASFTSIDPATGALDAAFGWAVTILFATTAVPGLVLAALSRAPRTALSFAVAFPTAFALLFLALVIAYAM